MDADLFPVAGLNELNTAYDRSRFYYSMEMIPSSLSSGVNCFGIVVGISLDVIL